MSEPVLHVLVLDDEASLREPLAEYLRGDYKYIVETASNGVEAMRLIEEAHGRYDVALIDAVLEEGLDGLEVLRQIKAKHPDIEVILFTGWGMEAAIDALRAGAYRYFAKPFNLEELALTIRFAAEQGQTHREQKILFLSAFQQVSTAISSTLELNEIMRLTCKAAVELFGVDHSGLVLFEEDYTLGRVVAEYPERVSPEMSGLVEVVFPVRGVPFEEDLVYSRQIVNVSDLRTATDLGPVLEVLLNSGIRSMLIVPVMIKGRVIGSFGLDIIHQPRVFSQYDIDLCMTLANQVGAAVENASMLRSRGKRAISMLSLKLPLRSVPRSTWIKPYGRRARQPWISLM